MHLSENEGIEKKSFVVTGGLGFIGAALCVELVRRGARLVKAFDLRTHSPWSSQLRQCGVQIIQGIPYPHFPFNSTFLIQFTFHSFLLKIFCSIQHLAD